MKLDWSKAKITDVFGKERVVSTRNGVLSLDIDDTPLYIENVRGWKNDEKPETACFLIVKNKG